MRTFILTGNSSILSADYCPPIDLRDDFDHEYVMGLINFETFNAIPNIDKKNNKFYIGNHEITIPIGAYEINNIEKFLKNEIDILNKTVGGFNCILELRANPNTLQCHLKSNQDIDFTKPNTIANLLGFENELLTANKLHVSKKPVNILKVNAIKIDCNITTGSYSNNQLGHTIHEFFPDSPPGFKIIERSQNAIYLPINTHVIDNITLKILDQDGDLINLREETVTIRRHLKHYGY